MPLKHSDNGPLYALLDTRQIKLKKKMEKKKFSDEFHIISN